MAATIKYEDVFVQERLKVIGVNEYFNTLVNDRVVSRKIINGT